MAVDPRFYDLVAHLWRNGVAAYYWTPDTDEGKLSFWFPAGRPKEVSSLWKSINVYFGVHPSSIERGHRERALIEHIAAVNCLFAEFDLAPGQTPEHLLQSIMQIDTPPSVVVFSGGGYHCYWLLAQTYHIDDEAARLRIIEIQYAWADFVGSDGAAKDLARVLRVPGTYNRKPERGPKFPLVKFVHFDMDTTYELDELAKQVETIIDTNRTKKVTAASVDVVPVDFDDQTILEKMWSKDPDSATLWAGDMTAYNDDHSAADMALCSKLAFWFGRDPERIDRVFRRSNLYRPKWLRDDYRARTIDKAIAGCANTYTGTQTNLGGVNDLVTLTQPQAAANGHTAPQSGPPPSVDDLLTLYSADDLGNAQAAFLLHGSEFIYCKTHGYLYYNGKFWDTQSADARLTQAIIDTLVRRRAAAVLRNLEAIVKATKPDASKVQNCIYLFKAFIEKDMTLFDASPELLNCQNGVVNLRTGTIQPHNAGQMFTYCVEVDYDPTADYTEWVDFLQVITDAPEVVDYLKLAVGYTATGYTNEECLFYIYGPTRSGKGTFTETLLTLLCKPLGVQADFATFTAKREGDMQNFDLAPLRPARFVVASESDKYDTLNEAKIKTITGGDWIRCAFKHKTHFEYRPQFKVWLVSNHPIKGDVDDDAFWGRAKLITFPHSHLGKEDKTLKNRMKSSANLRGVLRWIVEGAMEWFKNPQGLQTPPQVEAANTQRRHELDYVQQWLDACCVVNPTQWTANAAVFYSYKSWCEGVGIKTRGLKHWGKFSLKKVSKLAYSGAWLTDNAHAVSKDCQSHEQKNSVFRLVAQTKCQK